METLYICYSFRRTLFFCLAIRFFILTYCMWLSSFNMAAFIHTLYWLYTHVRTAENDVCNANVNDKRSRSTNYRQRKHENIEAYIREFTTFTTHRCGKRRRQSQHTHTTDMCDLSKSVTERDRANTIGGEGMRITCGFDLLSIVISPRFFAWNERKSD